MIADMSEYRFILEQYAAGQNPPADKLKLAIAWVLQRNKDLEALLPQPRQPGATG